MSNLTKVVWREYFEPIHVAALMHAGTLPRDEVMLDTRGDDGRDVAAAIAEHETSNGSELFRESGTKITIVEPEEFAGDYVVTVDYTPDFSAQEA